MAFINVIIPVYNGKQFLQEAVSSVLEQPFKDIEVVMVDDGSTDGSGELCDDIARQEPRVTVIHQDNGGVSAARNAAIDYILSKETDLTHGYVSFLDSDDFWIPGTIDDETVSRISACDQLDLIGFGGCSCSYHCSRFSRPEPMVDAVYDAGYTAIWKFGSFCLNLYSLELLRRWNIRFYVGQKYSEDKAFLMRCVYLSRKVVTYARCLHVYRRNPASAMSAAKRKSAIDYYLPIVSGWIKVDDELNQWESVTTRRSSAGYTLAGIYLMDMVSEHFKQWGSAKEIFEVLREHPCYYLFRDMRPQDVSKRNFANHELLLNHPRLFEIKFRLIGLLEYLLRSVISLPVIRDLFERKKLPLDSIPLNSKDR